ncbi:hypothetical protein AAVH_14761, partial [Aphelenchoides avenae]
LGAIFGILGLVLCSSVAFVSKIRRKCNCNIGPRIFTINLMAVDCVHSFFSLIHNLYIVSGAFQSLLMNLP